MKLNIEELAREAGIDIYTAWGVSDAALLAYTKAIVERCAKRCEDEDVATTDDPVGVQECIAATIRNLLED